MSEYNGWSSYETWQAALWLSESDYHETDAEDLEGFVRELADVEGKSGLYMDIFNGWLSSVNFHEIADHNEE